MTLKCSLNKEGKSMFTNLVVPTSIVKQVKKDPLQVMPNKATVAAIVS